ncbi:MAG: DUF3037 domain-containing protein [Nocardioides sp.]|nr:DUF3037 domain-containing protein [Nocardioides sp.]
MSGSGRLAYQYVVLRCVPRIEREEFVNVGVVLYCQMADYLAAAWRVDRDRLSALDRRLDLDQVRSALEFVEGVCAGDQRGGAAAGQPIGVRFGFVKAPKSTVLQPGPVHSGLAADPERELEHLLNTLVG